MVFSYDFTTVVRDDLPYFCELILFNQKFKGFTFRQNFQT